MPGPARRGPASERARDFKGTAVRLVGYLAHERIPLIIALICAIASVVFNVIGPRILGSATTKLFEGVSAKILGTGSIDFAGIGYILAGLLCLYITSAAFNFLQGWLMTGVTQRVCYRMRREIVEKIDRMPLSHFESNSVGDVLSRITNDVDTVGQSLNQCVTQLITSITQIIGVTVMMISVSAALAGITFLTIPVLLVLIVIVVRSSQRYFRQQQTLLGQVDGIIEESFSGQNVIKVFNREQRAVADFDKKNNLLYDAGWRAQFLSGLMQPIMNFVANLAYVAVVSVGAFLAITGAVTVGDIQAFMQYVRNFTQPITQLTQVSNMMQMLSAAAERVFEFLAEPEESPDATTPELPQATRGAISFDHVKFGYVPNKTIIHDFTCDVAPGQTVAIVGPTGAGKTTLMKLLMRFWKVEQGTVSLSGRSVEQINTKNLRELESFVTQETQLFHDSIRNNLLIAKLDATQQELEAACKKASVHDFILTLPQGYDTPVGELGDTLSGGERQRLGLARAFLHDAPFLLLDEPTSNLDSLNEGVILRSLKEQREDKTVVLVSHRRSTMGIADTVYSVEQGRMS